MEARLDIGSSRMATILNRLAEIWLLSRLGEARQPGYNLRRISRRMLNIGPEDTGQEPKILTEAKV
jgi:hypothetical protein